jgi:hypothetical protein
MTRALARTERSLRKTSLAKGRGSGTKLTLQPQRALRFDVIFLDRMQPVPQGKAASNKHAYKDADQEKPTICRERNQKNTYNEDCDEQAR